MAVGGGKPAWLVNTIRKQVAASRAKEAPLAREDGGKAKRARVESESHNEKENEHLDGAGPSSYEPAVAAAELDRALSEIATRAPRLHAALLPF